MDTVVRIIISVSTAAVMLAAAIDASGQQQVQQREQAQSRTQERAGKREIIPGSELMTSREREDYRRRYAAAKTGAEQEKVRADHIIFIGRVLRYAYSMRQPLVFSQNQCGSLTV